MDKNTTEIASSKAKQSSHPQLSGSLCESPKQSSHPQLNGSLCESPGIPHFRHSWHIMGPSLYPRLLTLLILPVILFSSRTWWQGRPLAAAGSQGLIKISFKLENLAGRESTPPLLGAHVRFHAGFWLILCSGMYPLDRGI